eukprot:CAMPEP_0115043726 /NCGR_PEP_ID=MMETSP0216-20121206/47049_1 /TAXON_ID=223996 /ORGANISM="Protocruzia adherens, Strain Boccale" /LENGTH=660 /DNA_ID=CAMNT_0002426119 /DNA_START=89 /DNA_END=2072 /DNA_ORIENTATION=+
MASESSENSPGAAFTPKESQNTKKQLIEKILTTKERSGAELEVLKAHLTSLRAVNELLQDLKEHQLRKFLLALTLKTFSAGTYVFRQGDRSDGFYIIFSGRVQILEKETGPRSRIRNETDPSHQVVNTLIEGMVFGERGLAKNKLRSASVYCDISSKLIKVDKKDFERLKGNYLKGMRETTGFMQKTIPALEDLSHQILEKFSFHFHHEVFLKRETIVRQGRRGEYLYFIQSGLVSMSKNSAITSDFAMSHIKRSHELSTFGEGSCFGDEILLDSNTTGRYYYTVTVQSEDLSVYKVHRRFVHERLPHDVAVRLIGAAATKVNFRQHQDEGRSRIEAKTVALENEIGQSMQPECAMTGVMYPAASKGSSKMLYLMNSRKRNTEKSQDPSDLVYKKATWLTKFSPSSYTIMAKSTPGSPRSSENSLFALRSKRRQKRSLHLTRDDDIVERNKQIVKLEAELREANRRDERNAKNVTVICPTSVTGNTTIYKRNNTSRVSKMSRTPSTSMDQNGSTTIQKGAQLANENEQGHAFIVPDETAEIEEMENRRCSVSAMGKSHTTNCSRTCSRACSRAQSRSPAFDFTPEPVGSSRGQRRIAWRVPKNFLPNQQQMFRREYRTSSCEPVELDYKGIVDGLQFDKASTTTKKSSATSNFFITAEKD